ncbi:hypothetical protein ARZXY2_4545 (plasmid) [Arthrobacter sp. ZXY-2]|nr:hypothetical protein ARZXY2_4545 [Arthrobacter sp. ZXY-2]
MCEHKGARNDGERVALKALALVPANPKATRRDSSLLRTKATWLA